MEIVGYEICEAGSPLALDNGWFTEALRAVPEELPFRGPEIFTKGDYHYHCKVDGEFPWFQGYEEIFYMDEKIYECYFHGGSIR